MINRLPAEAWAEIRHAYETTTEPASRIAARYGVTSGALYGHSLREDWGPRPKPPAAVPRPRPLLAAGSQRIAATPGAECSPAATPGAERSPAAVASAEDPYANAPPPGAPGQNEARDAPATSLAYCAPDRPEQRATRLLRLIDLQLDQMEKTMASGEPMTAQDQERNARAIASLTNQAAALNGTPSKDAADGAAGAGDARAEALRIRREIVEHLEKLHAERLARRGSE